MSSPARGRGGARGRGRGGSKSANNSDDESVRPSARRTRANNNNAKTPSSNGLGRGAVRGLQGALGQMRSPTVPKRGNQSTRGNTAQSNGLSQGAFGTSPSRSTNRIAPSVAERLKALRKARENERQDAIAHGFLADPDRPRTLAEAVTPVGTCQDMCPEYERLQRIQQNDVWGPEYDPETISLPRGKQIPEESRMVKKFKRSAAGTDDQLPSDLRPPAVLQRTCDYLFNQLLNETQDLKPVHHFIWDRTRAIRNDFSIQQLTKIPDIRVATDCYERIARFHILSLHLVGGVTERADKYDWFQDREQLDRTLLSLINYYDNARNHYRSPNEAEFRAYCVLFQIPNPTADLEDRVQTWPTEAICDPRVQRALKLYNAAQNISNPQGPLRERIGHPIAQSNWSRFWKLTASEETSYLMSCVAEINFNLIRRNALQSIWRSFRQRGNTKSEDWSLEELADALGFDEEKQVQTFVESYQFRIVENDGGKQYLDLNSVTEKTFPEPTARIPAQQFSNNIVEAKRCGRTLSAVINGLSTKAAVESGMIMTSNQEPQARDSHSIDPKEPTLFVPDDSEDDGELEFVDEPSMGTTEPEAEKEKSDREWMERYTAEKAAAEQLAAEEKAAAEKAEQEKAAAEKAAQEKAAAEKAAREKAAAQERAAAERAAAEKAAQERAAQAKAAQEKAAAEKAAQEKAAAEKERWEQRLAEERQEKIRAEKRRLEREAAFKIAETIRKDDVHEYLARQMTLDLSWGILPTYVNHVAHQLVKQEILNFEDEQDRQQADEFRRHVLAVRYWHRWYRNVRSMRLRRRGQLYRARAKDIIKRKSQTPTGAKQAEADRIILSLTQEQTDNSLNNLPRISTTTRQPPEDTPSRHKMERKSILQNHGARTQPSTEVAVRSTKTDHKLTKSASPAHSTATSVLSAPGATGIPVIDLIRSQPRPDAKISTFKNPYYLFKSHGIYTPSRQSLQREVAKRKRATEDEPNQTGQTPVEPDSPESKKRASQAQMQHLRSLSNESHNGIQQVLQDFEESESWYRQARDQLQQGHGFNGTMSGGSATSSNAGAGGGQPGPACSPSAPKYRSRQSKFVASEAFGARIACAVTRSREVTTISRQEDEEQMRREEAEVAEVAAAALVVANRAGHANGNRYSYSNRFAALAQDEDTEIDDDSDDDDVEEEESEEIYEAENAEIEDETEDDDEEEVEIVAPIKSNYGTGKGASADDAIELDSD